MCHKELAITQAENPEDDCHSNIFPSLAYNPVGLKNTEIIDADDYTLSNDYLH